LFQVESTNGNVIVAGIVGDFASRDAGFLEVGFCSGLVSHHLDFNTSSELEISSLAVEAQELKIILLVKVIIIFCRS
jgi:hypothetical protein